MTTIAFFAHDEKDAAVRRRVFAFKKAGYDVAGFSMRRSELADSEWNTVDLGRTHDARFMHRAGAILAGARKAAAARPLLANSDVLYARNLDMALCSQLAMLMTGLKRPLVYECLDVHRLMHRNDSVGMLLRLLERFVLARSALLVVSSPGFLREYFHARHPGKFRAYLIENRLADSPLLGPRPPMRAKPSSPLRIGWFGVLRCRRSLDLLESLAIRFGSEIEIILRGYPDVMLPDFHERVRKHHNIRYRGRYKSPEDLQENYAALDLVWAGDFHDAGFNSRWLLPNRLYEGGYFGVPAIAPQDSETGRWVNERTAGFTVAEPLEETFPALVQGLLASPDRIAEMQTRLLGLPRDTFIQPRDEIRTVIREALSSRLDSRAVRREPTAAKAVSSDC